MTSVGFAAKHPEMRSVAGTDPGVLPRCILRINRARWTDVLRAHGATQAASSTPNTSRATIGLVFDEPRGEWRL